MRSAGSSDYNYENPIWRDVVSTGTPGDNVTIRFRVSVSWGRVSSIGGGADIGGRQTDNPGPWFLHCHIDFHLEAGFAVVFAEDIPDTKLANPVPQAWSDLCPIYDALPEEDR